MMTELEIEFKLSYHFNYVFGSLKTLKNRITNSNMSSKDWNKLDIYKIIFVSLHHRYYEYNHYNKN